MIKKKYSAEELANMSDFELDGLPYHVSIKELERRAAEGFVGNYKEDLSSRLSSICLEIYAFYEVYRTNLSFENISKWNNLQASKYIIESKIKKLNK